MAIQFHCPSCDAMIRVPDNAAGKKGTCPQCSEKLLVPDVVPAGSVAAPAISTPEPASPPRTGRRELPRLDQAAPPMLGEDTPRLDPLSSAPSAGSGLPDFSHGARSTSSALPGLPPLVSNVETSVAVSLKKKATQKRRKNQGAWIVPVICVAGLIGVIAWFFINSQPKLEGQLEAQSVRDLQVKPGEIPGSLSGLSKSDLGEVLRHLKAEPVRWTSSTSRMTLKGTETGVEVSLDPGTATHFVRVEPNKIPSFLDYATKHASELDKPRLATIAKNAPKLFAAWKVQFDKHEPISDQKLHRDNVALPSLVTGVGYHLEAVVNGNVHPCVYEDDDGRVYFLLPNATKHFVLQGKRIAGTTIPAKFTVKINRTITASSESGGSKRKTAEDREAENQGMNPDLDKAEMEESESEHKQSPKSSAEALKTGLGNMLSDDMPAKSKSKSKSKAMEMEGDEMMDDMPAKPNSKPKSKAMEMEMEGDEMMDEIPSKSMPKKGKPATKSKAAMDKPDTEMSELEEEMPARPQPKKTNS